MVAYPPFHLPIRLISVVLGTQVIPDRRDERVQLREERNRPHDVHGRSREDKRRAPDTVENSSAARSHAIRHFQSQLASRPRSASATPGPRPTLPRDCHSRLVLALGRKHPCAAAEYHDHDQPDERCPAALCQSPGALRGELDAPVRHAVCCVVGG
jgi:hypothetical protein